MKTEAAVTRDHARVVVPLRGGHEGRSRGRSRTIQGEAEALETAQIAAGGSAWSARKNVKVVSPNFRVRDRTSVPDPAAGGRLVRCWAITIPSEAASPARATPPSAPAIAPPS